jgi:predicted amidohydrolase
LLRARAIENQCYVIGVNRVGTDGTGLVYTGKSQSLNLLGENLPNLSPNQGGTIRVKLGKTELESTRLQLPFLKDI